MPGAAGEGEAGDGDAAGLGWAGQRPASPPLVKQSPWIWGSWGITGGVSASGSVKRVLVPLGRFGNTDGQTKWVKWSKPQEILGEGAGGGAT